MNFKKQAIVAAAILAVAGAANAKLSDLNTGNTSLAFVALDAVAKTSTVVDLGTTFKDFLPQGTTGNVIIPGDGSVASGFQNTANALTYTPGTTLSWDFSTSTFKVNGAAQTTALNGKAIDWSAFSTFKAGTTAANTKWAVIGAGTGLYNLDPVLDVNGYGAQGPSVQIATTSATTPVFDSATIANAGGKVSTLFTNNGSLNASATTTATVASVGSSAYAGNDAQFGVAGKWGNELAQSALAAIGTSQSFYYTNELPLDGTAGSGLVVKYDGTFAFNGTALTYTVPGAVTPSVPEPEGYALAFVGLAAVGFAARRRQA